MLAVKSSEMLLTREAILIIIFTPLFPFILCSYFWHKCKPCFLLALCKANMRASISSLDQKVRRDVCCLTPALFTMKTVKMKHISHQEWMTWEKMRIHSLVIVYLIEHKQRYSLEYIIFKRQFLYSRECYQQQFHPNFEEIPPQ